MAAQEGTYYTKRSLMPSRLQNREPMGISPEQAVGRLAHDHQVLGTGRIPLRIPPTVWFTRCGLISPLGRH